MPVVTIEMREGRTAEEKSALHEAVHQAMEDTLGIPAYDRMQRIVEYKPVDFTIPPNKSEKFTLITITMFPGRSDDAKRNLYQALVTRLEPLGIPPMDVFIVLQETDLVNWGIRGGIPASEVELGFEVNV